MRFDDVAKYSLCVFGIVDKPTNNLGNVHTHTYNTTGCKV